MLELISRGSILSFIFEVQIINHVVDFFRKLNFEVQILNHVGFKNTWMIFCYLNLFDLLQDAASRVPRSGDKNGNGNW